MVITNENQLYEQWSREFRKSREIFRHNQEQHIFVLFVCSLVYVVVRIYYVILQDQLSTYLELLYSFYVSFFIHMSKMLRSNHVQF